MSEMVTIVNEQDEILGYKPRDEVDYVNDIYRVSALWLTNSVGEILIAQRKLTKDKDPGKWGPAVAGTVEQGETYEQNIVKETEEEIGITGLSFERGPKKRLFEPRNYFGQWFKSIIDLPSTEFHIQEAEVEQVAWISPEKLKNEVFNTPEKYVPGFPEVIKDLIV